jgi:hypothetical protein
VPSTISQSILPHKHYRPACSRRHVWGSAACRASPGQAIVEADILYLRRSAWLASPFGSVGAGFFRLLAKNEKVETQYCKDTSSANLVETTHYPPTLAVSVQGLADVSTSRAYLSSEEGSSPFEDTGKHWKGSVTEYVDFEGGEAVALDDLRAEDGGRKLLGDGGDLTRRKELAS